MKFAELTGMVSRAPSVVPGLQVVAVPRLVSDTGYDTVADRRAHPLVRGSVGKAAGRDGEDVYGPVAHRVTNSVKRSGVRGVEGARGGMRSDAGIPSGDKDVTRRLVPRRSDRQSHEQPRDPHHHFVCPTSALCQR